MCCNVIERSVREGLAATSCVTSSHVARQVHDFWHVLSGYDVSVSDAGATAVGRLCSKADGPSAPNHIPTNVLPQVMSEIALKWLEMVQVRALVVVSACAFRPGKAVRCRGRPDCP